MLYGEQNAWVRSNGSFKSALFSDFTVSLVHENATDCSLEQTPVTDPQYGSIYVLAVYTVTAIGD